MDSAVWGFVGVVIGGLITGGVTLWAQKLRGDQEAALDGAKRQDDRTIARDQFQRANLLELQERFHEWWRVVTQLDETDVRILREHGRLTQVPEGISEREFDVGRRLIYLTERVTDDGLRGALRDVRARATAREVDKLRRRDTITPEEIEEASQEFKVAMAELHERLGQTLRRYL
jgi:hypothetical protein